MTIKAVETVRKIRDALYEKTKNMTAEEQIAFYKAEAKKLETKRASRKKDTGK
ncbi:MAG: hypothetical protein NUW37_09845 [Planctomycetes bacterium]|nr:hypothetical protein [Planctomycetota bacterium]